MFYYRKIRVFVFVHRHISAVILIYIYTFFAYLGIKNTRKPSKTAIFSCTNFMM